MDAAQPFAHLFPRQRLVLAHGAIDRVASETTAEGVTRPLIVCSARGRRSALFARMFEGFDASAVTVWDDVPLHAPVSTTLKAAAVARDRQCDGIVAFGGGSVSDLAKGVALALAEGDDLERFQLRREAGRTTGTPTHAPKVPLLAIPTTLSGAEVTPGFSLTRDDTYKLLFRDLQLAARVLVFDPLVLDDIAPSLLAGSLANALAHGCEALYSTARTPISSVFARDGLRHLMTGADAWFATVPATGGAALSNSETQDRRAGAHALLLGSYMVAAAIINARTALHHAACHKLAPVLGASHGEINALVLPHALAFNLPACSETLLADIAQAIEPPGAHDAPPGLESVIERLGRYGRSNGLRTRLREFGLARSGLPDIAGRIFAEPGLAFNPRPIDSTDQILELLERAW